MQELVKVKIGIGLAALFLSLSQGCAPDTGATGAEEQKALATQPAYRQYSKLNALQNLAADAWGKMKGEFDRGVVDGPIELTAVSAKPKAYAFKCEEALLAANKPRAASARPVDCPDGKTATGVPLQSGSTYSVLGYRESSSPNYNFVKVFVNGEELYTGAENLKIVEVAVFGTMKAFDRDINPFAREDAYAAMAGQTKKRVQYTGRCVGTFTGGKWNIDCSYFG